MKPLTTLSLAFALASTAQADVADSDGLSDGHHQIASHSSNTMSQKQGR